MSNISLQRNNFEIRYVADRYRVNKIASLFSFTAEYVFFMYIIYIYLRIRENFIILDTIFEILLSMGQNDSGLAAIPRGYEEYKTYDLFMRDSRHKCK